MRRVLCLWLPRLPLDRLIRKGGPAFEGPFAMIAELKNAWRIAHANEAALCSGVLPGQSLADARAICPSLLTHPVDPVSEAALLRALRRWADQFSPLVAIHEPDALLLDIYGVAHLFGGETALAQDALQKLADLGITARAGIADTRRAATALAKYATSSPAIASPGQTQTCLPELPIEALDCPPSILNGLRRAGFATLGQLFDIRSADLARRYGTETAKARSALLGHEPDPVRMSALDPVYAARMTLPEPIGYQSDLQDIIRRLARRICDRLHAQTSGARRFHLIVRCIDSGDHLLSVGFARPCDQPDQILQQFAHQLDKLKLTYGADWFRLWAEQIEALHPGQSGLFGKTTDNEKISSIITTIGNRIGFDRTLRFLPQASHLPERSFACGEAATRDPAQSWPARSMERPALLYDRPHPVTPVQPGRPPVRFEWERRAYQLCVAKGPERLTPEWWRAEDTRTRDYWIVQTEEGPRFWLMTYPGDPSRAWYMAGRFT